MSTPKSDRQPVEGQQSSSNGLVKAWSLKDLMKLRLGQKEQLPDDDSATQNFPTLWKLLTERYPDMEHVCEPARLVISVGLGCWIVRVTHNDLKVSFECTSQTLEYCFQAWETAARSDPSKWKVFGRGDINLRKRKKEN